jgi:diguanylate cyclase (GGDEF)-like protein/PAS domain S-box-containing protein
MRNAKLINARPNPKSAELINARPDPESAESAESESRLRQLEQVIELSDESVVVKDLDGIVTLWNRAATALYGFSAAEAIGRPLRELHAADLSDAQYAALLSRIRAGKPTASTEERRTKSGETVRVTNNRAPLLDAQGYLTGEITIARDVTALHRSQEALRRAQASLEAKVKSIHEANRSLKGEMRSRRATEAAMRAANVTLESTVRKLESFNRDDAALSRMAELLQSSTQREEAYAVVRETSAKLFPGAVGRLYIHRESRDALEHVAAWGAQPGAEHGLAPDECWALRLGRPHFVSGAGAIGCRHAQGGAPSYVCMPLQGEGQILGLLHIALEIDAETARPAQGTERRLRVLADRIGPALANLKLRDALRVLALHDALTGLYNRRYMDDALKRELRRAERSGKPVALIMIDIDHFKRFNDTFGHDAGDYVLTMVAKIITKNVRPSDFACRYGGEELAVLLPESGAECAVDRAEKLRLAIRQLDLTHRGQTLPAPTASFGVAEHPQHGANAADLIKAADRALYRAKEAGRDRVCATDTAVTGPGNVQ